MNRESYESLVKQEQYITQALEEQKTKMSAGIERIRELAEKYQEEFKAFLINIGNDLSVLTTNKDIRKHKASLKQKINDSENLSDEEKASLLSSLDQTFRRISSHKGNITKLEKEQKEIREKIDYIKNKVIIMDRYNRSQSGKIATSIEERKKRIEELEKLISDPKNSNELKAKVKKEIEQEKANIVSLQQSMEKMKSKTAGQNITEESAQAILDEEEKKKEEVVTPEGPKKPKNRHFASPELINKIKKGGKIIGGIALVAGAVALAVTNPALLLAIPGIKVANDFIKNYQGKSK